MTDLQNLSAATCGGSFDANSLLQIPGWLESDGSLPRDQNGPAGLRVHSHAISPYNNPEAPEPAQKDFFPADQPRLNRVKNYVYYLPGIGQRHSTMGIMNCLAQVVLVHAGMQQKMPI